MEIDRENLKKLLPNLSKELEFIENKISIKSIRTEKVSYTKHSKRLIEDMPDVVDFIRRCNNNEQAEEIINFLEKKGEILPEDSKKLREQLKNKGLRSFGSKKEENYYFKNSI